MVEIHTSDGPAQPGEGVFHQQKPIGSITSAAYGHRTDKNLAMAYIDPQFVDEGTEINILLFGQSVRASVCTLGVFDPKNTIPRAQD